MFGETGESRCSRGSVRKGASPAAFRSQTYGVAGEASERAILRLCSGLKHTVKPAKAGGEKPYIRKFRVFGSKRGARHALKNLEKVNFSSIFLYL